MFELYSKLCGFVRLHCIERNDLSLQVCQQILCIVANNLIGSDDYEKGHAAGAFLQGYQEPTAEGNDGRFLIEFWTDDTQAIQAFADHLNREFVAKGF